MKLKLYLLISIVFILNIAMKCDEKDAEETIPPKLIGIEIYNVNNEGKNPIVSDEPIKKEAYIIAISYLEEDEYTHADYYYNITGSIKSERIYCNVDIGTEYPAGSEISKLFSKIIFGPKPYSHAFVLRKSIPVDTYIFKVVVTDNEDKVFEASTNPIELY